MKVKRAGMLTKILLILLLIVAVTTFLDLRGQLKALAREQTVLERRVAQQKQENESLAAAIADSKNPERIANVARDRLGMVAPGEIVFFDSGN